MWISTPNKAGQITEYVRAYVEIGSYKTTQHFFVTNLGNKEMMIGYLYLYKHNPNIDWQKKVNGSSPGAQIYALVKSVKYEM